MLAAWLKLCTARYPFAMGLCSSENSLMREFDEDLGTLRLNFTESFFI
jgi:hypothetical protein